MKDNTLTLEIVLDRLFSEEIVSIPLVYNLSDLSPEELSFLAQRWAEQPAERRGIIARHMADISEINFEVDFSPAFAIFLEDEAEVVRLAALDGLWDSSNTMLVTPVIDLVRRDPSIEVRALAAATLGHYVLMSEWGQLPKKVGERIVTALLDEIEATETAVAVRRAILETVAPAAHPRVPSLIEEAYASGDELMQLSAVFAMGGSADERWLPIVIDELESPVTEMRLEAARAAGSIGSRQAVADLADLTADEDLEVQLMAVHALGQIGGDVAQGVLSDLANDPEAEDLYDAIDEALEELSWLGGDVDFSILNWEPDENTDA